MKIDKLSIDGKKQSIEVLDKIFSAKINNPRDLLLLKNFIENSEKIFLEVKEIKKRV